MNVGHKIISFALLNKLCIEQKFSKMPLRSRIKISEQCSAGNKSSLCLIFLELTRRAGLLACYKYSILPALDLHTMYNAIAICIHVVTSYHNPGLYSAGEAHLLSSINNFRELSMEMATILRTVTATAMSAPGPTPRRAPHWTR